MRQFRQGDVFIEQIEETGGSGEPIQPDSGRVVLEYGEVTGHAHAIYEPQHVQFYRPEPVKDRTVRHLRALQPVKLLHEEHAPIELPAGLYRITRQREYHPEEIRYVAD